MHHLIPLALLEECIRMGLFRFFTRVETVAATDIKAAQAALLKLGITPGVESTLVHAVALMVSGDVVGAETLFASALTTHQAALAARPTATTVASSSPAAPLKP